MRRNSWTMQLLKIEDKGYAAGVAGVPQSECPYSGGYRNQNGAGGSLQRQRREFWKRGWLRGSKAKGQQCNTSTT